MTDSDDTKTKKELLAEIEALKQQLAAKNAGAGEDTSGESREPSFSRPITRREALKNWIAPVVLSVPITAALSTEKVHAQAAPAPEPAPAPPTSAPTLEPPTQAPPTSAPTLEPPTRAPQPAEARAVPGLGAAGAVALGGALAAAGAKMLKDKKKASDGNTTGGDSGTE